MFLHPPSGFMHVLLQPELQHFMFPRHCSSPKHASIHPFSIGRWRTVGHVPCLLRWYKLKGRKHLATQLARSMFWTGITEKNKLIYSLNVAIVGLVFFNVVFGSSFIRFVLINISILNNLKRVQHNYNKNYNIGLNKTFLANPMIKPPFVQLLLQPSLQHKDPSLSQSLSSEQPSFSSHSVLLMVSCSVGHFPDLVHLVTQYWSWNIEPGPYIKHSVEWMVMPIPNSNNAREQLIMSKTCMD